MTLQTAPPDLAQLKSGMKATWMAGDFGQIAHFIAPEAEHFIARLNLKPGIQFLDVACGTGNIAIPAAKAGAKVTGIDIATNLLEQARIRAAAAQLDIEFKEAMRRTFPAPTTASTSWSACSVPCSRRAPTASRQNCCACANRAA